MSDHRDPGDETDHVEDEEQTDPPVSPDGSTPGGARMPRKPKPNAPAPGDKLTVKWDWEKFDDEREKWAEEMRKSQEQLVLV